MATRVVTFTFAPDPATVALLDHFVLNIVDSVGTLLANANIAKTETSYSIAMGVGTGYIATLKALNGAGVIDAHPPSVTFDVPPPPPTVPGDPTLNPPTIS